jgi:ABC-type branched-subunit amino acid transport system permease subunit
LTVSRSDQFVVFLVGLFATYALMAVGLNLVVGGVGEISVGHSGIAAIGAYCGLLTLPFGPAVALLVAVVAGLLGGALMGLPRIRVGGFGLAAFTFVIGQAIPTAIGQAPDLGGHFGRSVPLPRLFDAVVRGPYLAVAALVLLSIGLFVAWRIQRSMVGRAWSAVRENERMASALSINPHTQRILAFAVSGAFAGVGGLLLILHTQYVAPDLFSVALSIEMLAMVIVGGRGSTLGPVLGAGFFVLGEQFVPTREAQTLIFGAALALMVWFLPDGVLSAPSAIRAILRNKSRWWRRREAAS